MEIEYSKQPDNGIAKWLLAMCVGEIHKHTGVPVDMSEGSQELPLDLVLTANGYEIDIKLIMDSIDIMIRTSRQDGFDEGHTSGKDEILDRVTELLTMGEDVMGEDV